MTDDGTTWLRKMIREEIVRAIQEEADSSAELYDDKFITEQDAARLEETGFVRYKHVWHHPMHWEPFFLTQDWANMLDEEIEALPRADITIFDVEFTALSPEAKKMAGEFYDM